MKPLNVQVAEALGCKPESINTGFGQEWFCRCPGGSTHDADGSAGRVADYDTDWSATGPLIVKYRIDLKWWDAKYGLKEPVWMAARYDGGTEDEDEAGYGATPLLAVCDLILLLKAAGKL